MSDQTRRQLLGGFLGSLAQAVGTVVLARSVLSEARAESKEAGAQSQPNASLQERADLIVAGQPAADGEYPQTEESQNQCGFANGGFANGGGGGGFGKGGFANGGGGGGFHNGGFANGGGGGGFRNGAFRNY